MTLQPCNKTLPNTYNKRQREEAKSDSEEYDSRSDNAGEDGTNRKFLRRHPRESKDQKFSMTSIKANDASSDSEDDPGASDTDQEHGIGVNTQKFISPFHKHLDCNLSEAEVQNLSKKKWEYKWELPAFNKKNCKWVGTGECFLKDVNENFGYGLKEKLYKHWLETYEKSGGTDFCSSKQRFFFSICNSYRDFLHCNKKPFYIKGVEEDSSMKVAYIIHALNHIFSTRDLVRKNDSKVAKHQDSAQDELLTADGFLDRGFTRPKVLILLPFRSIAVRVVKRLIQLTPQAYKVNVEHVDRFYDEFGTQDDEDNVDVDKSVQNVENSKPLKSSKPSDHEALFGGNNDDNFMIGIKFTRRSIKLYSDFYSSDMIVASPLALHTRIEEAMSSKEKDYDFLSSLEVLVIDHADVIALQNWNYLSNVLEHLNLIPSKQHGTDIMRIRKWYLDKNARNYRQTIILSHYINPDINASFNHQCVNHEGKVKLVSTYKGILPKIERQVRQIYERFVVNSITDADDARHDYFVKKVFPKIKDSIQGGIMLFVSSYLEYVKLRNFLKSQNASFCALADYTKQSDVSRARLEFFEGKKKIMLYTERRHFYSRYKIRGIKTLIIYSLPDRMDFYPEMVNMLEEDNSNSTSCTVFFSKFDQLRLERIVGTTNARRLLTSDKNVFLFC
ncbi:protein NUCLEOLAR FACTOR 1 [Mercurialis annua]|uniref:protein NUCLEOLAR FACTOR 1 n=1 Tax=Mercurialis annua TaxID=3986 RepID=UPI00215FDC3E|nr:protein NUCLEOLAR FACTOR 1 [Mercurialis annua]